MDAWMTALRALAVPPDESGEVNTAAILAWMVLAVVIIAAINITFDGLVTDVMSNVQSKILGIG